MEFTENYEYILVRYGELSTKGRNKKDFIRQLIKNVKYSLEDYKDLRYQADRDRLYIFLNGNDPLDIEEKLKKVFGIRSFSLAMKTLPELDEMKAAAISAAKKEEKEGAKTFKVVARRNDKQFPLISDEVNREIGGVVLANTGLKVDVHQPDFKLIVEIHKDAAYIMAHTVLGAGGYPVRVGGKALVLLSGGIDSPVAAYQMQKRGVLIEAIHFASEPYTSEKAKEKVITLASMISNYQGNLRVKIIPFTKLQLAIYDNCPESYAITIMRRMMMRIAQRVAIDEKCLVLVTGESIGQVASQTLESIAVINEVVTMPIIRPLASFDKLEIIEKAKELGTYETSILPYEDCCTIFTPKNPVIKPKLELAKEYEERFNYQEYIDEAVKDLETIIVPLREKEG